MPTDVRNEGCPNCALRAALGKASFGLETGDSGQFATVTVDSPGIPEEDALLPDSVRLQPGARIHYFGDYELLEELGRGGMGVVFRARQVTLNREVALKMILAGRFASGSEVKRFHTEAEAAGRLQHPNIVAVHEVGFFEGQHYFSMDLVRGRDLGAIVRERPLGARKAAEYVRTVAEAVHHAHGQGVLHRDLKPSNVMIDSDDRPRITDFGLAKQLGSDTDLTSSGQIIGSPNFMAPEQASGKRVQAGPSSDVYSLGALLYHSLAGRPPFVAENLQALLAQVLASEPVPVRAMNPQVPIDLETVCLKCLEKDPSKRYPSARELAEELFRFIRGEPVLARPVGRVVRLARWCGRNRPLAGSLAAVALLLLVSAAGSSYSAWRLAKSRDAEIAARLRAMAAEHAAREESTRSKEVAQFLKDMLAGVGPSVARGRDTAIVREILDKSVERIDRDLKQQPAVEADLWNLVGNVYEEIGAYEQAEQAQRRALELQSKIFPNGDPRQAAMLSDLANVFARMARFQDAEIASLRALHIRSNYFGIESLEMAQSFNNLGTICWRQGKLREAESCYTNALALFRKIAGENDPRVAAGFGNLGTLYGAMDRTSRAEEMFRIALSLQQKLLGAEHPAVAKSLSNLANSLSNQGKWAEAEGYFAEAVSLRRKLLGDEHPDLAISLNNLGAALAAQKKSAQAEQVHREALAIRRKRLGNEHPDTALSLFNHGRALDAEGRFADAERALRECMEIRRKILKSDDPDLLGTQQSLASALEHGEKLNEAAQLYRELLPVVQRVLGPEHGSTVACSNRLFLLLNSDPEARAE